MKLTAYLNNKDLRVDEIREMLERTGVDYSRIETSGPCMLRIQDEGEPAMLLTGPPAIKHTLDLIIKEKDSKLL